ncbi:sideroflexin-5-like isoform X3 [Halichondria panicea]|uniref:sideroflexin-5-like isoform X3 n=1 Tax=Halichondria panicea TaxID=6063 RepID=UPI00312BBA7F
MANKYPPFVFGQPRFDQSSFQGRLRHFLDVVDPRTLFTSERKLKDSVKLLDDFKKGTLVSGVSNKEVTGLLLPSQGFAQMIFWQWLNQSHNACVNYANRNASKPTPTSRFVQGYVGAVSAAIGIAVSLNALLQKADKFSPAKKMMVQRFIPYPAVACASTINTVLMRNHELTEGIEVVDDKGNVVGTSKIAAKKAVTQTAITRFVLPAPILVIPPIIMTAIEKTDFIRKFPKMHLPIQAMVCTVCFGLALPASIALFPQIIEIDVTNLEPEFREKTSRQTLFFNKGL